PLEWLHCHVARKPEALTTIDATIPDVVAGIVGKLLEKTAEERYQSAVGIAADLQRCRDMLFEQGRIDRFPLGQDDRVDTFHLPQRLYGRERELAVLRAAFDR